MIRMQINNKAMVIMLPIWGKLNSTGYLRTYSHQAH